MPSSTDHEARMRDAMEQAKKGIGLTCPNPIVGAVLVRRGRMIARGFHRRAGADHAEVDCLRKVRDVGDATLYLTLEPCSTQGRTPPCVDYIVERRVRNVVIGTHDPNPRHNGRGVSGLRAAGIDVTTGVLETECRQLNAPYNKWIVSGLPLVIAKCAMSLDGRLTTPSGESRWLSSPDARAHAQQLRAKVDAILVGAETIRQDDSRLTVRSGLRRQQPWRVVLTRSGRLPHSARVFEDSHRDRTLIYRNKSLKAVLRDLGRRDVLSVLIEGGGQILTEALDRQLIDKFQIYIAPIFTGGKVVAFAGKGAASADGAIRFVRPSYQRIGSDICVTGDAEDKT